MKIKLKGQIDLDLLRIEFKPGDVVDAEPDMVGTTGAMYFMRIFKGTMYDCVVWPENYDMEPVSA
jgi:hypothetical protein